MNITLLTVVTFLNFLMRKFQQKVPSAKPEEWWTQMEEVFNLKWFNNK